MKRYREYMNTRTVDTVLHKKIMQNLTEKPKSIYQRQFLVRYAIIAVSAFALLFSIWTIPGLFNSQNINNSSNGFVANQPSEPQNNGQNGYVVDDLDPTQSGSEMISDSSEIDNLLPPEFVGLPMVNHCLPQENPNASRMGVGSLLDILGTPGRAVEYWRNNSVQAFAFVRVIEVVQEEDTLSSTVEVLRTVWSRGRELPETMILVQSSGAIMCCTPYGEMMREGGVFLLPLWYNDGTMQGWREGWFNWTYRDVLFEIDDKGLVWSRSNNSAFNRFDGRHTSVLAGAILGIANGDENLGRDIAHTPYGFASDDSVLAVVTAISSESTLLWADVDMWTNRYTVRVDEILSTPTPFGLQRGGWFEQQQLWRDNWQTSEEWWAKWEQNSMITAVNYTRHLVENGERYLVFITPSYGNWSSQFNFFGESAARINSDGTITSVQDVVDNWNVFDDYDGYTVEQLRELAHLANTWHERYAE